MQNLAALAAIASNGNGIPSLGSGEFILLFFKIFIVVVVVVVGYSECLFLFIIESVEIF